jgi:hypothetical protein
MHLLNENFNQFFCFLFFCACAQVYDVIERNSEIGKKTKKIRFFVN